MSNKPKTLEAIEYKIIYLCLVSNNHCTEQFAKELMDKIKMIRKQEV